MHHVLYRFSLSLALLLAGIAFAWNPSVNLEDCRAAMGEGLRIQYPYEFIEFEVENYTPALMTAAPQSRSRRRCLNAFARGTSTRCSRKFLLLSRSLRPSRA